MKISILEKLDLYLSVLIVVFSSLLLISYTYFIGFNVKIVTCLIFMIIGSITYLFLRDGKHTERQGFMEHAKTCRLLLNIAFVLLMTVSFLLLFNDLYIRPFSYFISISVLSLLIFLEVEVSDSKLILPKILLLSANLRIGLLYKFPSIIGGDGAYHYGLIKAALVTGDVVGKTEFFYSEYPIPHINALVHMLVAGVNYKDALTTSWAVPLSLISVLFVFLIGRELFSEEIGLVASLLITLFPYDIWYSYHLAPMAFATALIPLMLYLVVIRKSEIHFLFGIVSLIVIVLSHPLAMVEILIMGFGLFIGSLIYRINYKNSRIFPFILIIVIILTRWIYFVYLSWIGRIITSISTLYTETISMLMDPTSILSSTYISSNLTSFNDMLNTLGFSIFLCISIIGILHILKTGKKSLHIFQMLCATVLFSSVVIGFSSIGVGVVQHRWFGPMGMLLAIPAAISIKKGLVKKSVSAPIMFILAFFMITNSIVNIDSPIYAKEDTVRWAFTQSEMSAADWSFQKASGILTDYSYTAYTRSLQFRYEPQKASSDDGLILIRDYILEHAFYKGEKYILNIKFEKGEIKTLEPSQISVLNDKEKNIILNLDQILSKVYENGNVKAYYQNPLQLIDKEK